MKDLIALARMMNLYYHHLHNISSGVSFQGDHELMAEFYSALDAAYDMLVERYMGLGGQMEKSDLLGIITEAHSVLDQIPDEEDMDTNIQYALSLEASFRAEIEAEAEEATPGTQNLLQQLCDESEVRTYKLRQRSK